MTPKYSLIVFRGMSNDRPQGGESHITRPGSTFYFTNSPNCKFLVTGLGTKFFCRVELPKSGKSISVSDFKSW